MAGEQDLATLLATMEPERRSGEFVYVSGAFEDAEAFVREDEGPSAVVRRERADALGLRYDFVAAWITLRVHSSLEAVGLTAAVSAALTEAGISCNVIAGLRHDHLLVPADRGDDALAVLRGLAA